MAKERMSNEEATKRRNKRTNEHKKKHYDRLGLLAPKGAKAVWVEYANANGLSLSQLVVKAVEAYMEENSDNSEINTYTIK